MNGCRPFKIGLIALETADGKCLEPTVSCSEDPSGVSRPGCHDPRPPAPGRFSKQSLPMVRPASATTQDSPQTRRRPARALSDAAERGSASAMRSHRRPGALSNCSTTSTSRHSVWSAVPSHPRPQDEIAGRESRTGRSHAPVVSVRPRLPDHVATGRAPCIVGRAPLPQGLAGSNAGTAARSRPPWMREHHG